MKVLQMGGVAAVTCVLVVLVVGVFLSFRAAARPSRYPRAAGLRDIGVWARPGLLGAVAGAAGAGLVALTAPVHGPGGVGGLGAAYIAGVAADSCRYLVEYHKGAGAYRGSARQLVMLGACFLVGAEMTAPMT